MKRIDVLGILFSILAVFGSAQGSDEEWSRFRGPNGTGISQSQAFPSSWGDSNVLWRVPPLGPGISSPSVWKNHFVITSSNDDGTVRRVECRRLADGGLEWSKEIAFDTNPKHGKNSYATATAACEKDGTYVVFGSKTRFVVLALDWLGRVRWEKDLGPYESRHGCGASPVLLGERVIIAKEADGPSEVVALNRSNGEVDWRVTRDGPLAAYATPVIEQSSQGEQILVSSTAGLAGLDPRSGGTIWAEKCFPDRCVGSPVLGGGLVLATCGEGGKGKHLVAVRTGAPSTGRDSRKAWEETRTIPYCPTPIVVDDLVFFVTDQGIARCVALDSGKEIWTERMLSNTSASPVCVGGRIVIIGEDGNAVVFAAEPTVKILARNFLDDQFLSTPAMAGDRMLVRGKQYVWCIGAGKSE